MDCLVVGDTHITKDSLEECDKLFDFIKEQSELPSVQKVILLGDDIDGFGQPSAIVQHFLYNKLLEIKKPVIVLLGNHSFAPNHQRFHSLLPLKMLSHVTVVDEPMSIDGISYMPYRKHFNQFIAEENALSNTYHNKLLFCHQSFVGAAFENGFIEKHAASLDDTLHPMLISGHHHKECDLGRCYYPGSPRWLRKVDANHDKFIMLFDSKTFDKVKLSTHPTVTKMVKLEIKEGQDYPALDELNTKYLLTISGSHKFCQDAGEHFKGQAEMKFAPHRQKKAFVIKNTNNLKALEEYILKTYQPHYGIDNQTLLETLKGRLR